ncbi:MAG: hypothetical protein HC904_11580 [Blastochloris sp.]|nr:hypothetical protein [Blastochloris sp.]
MGLGQGFVQFGGISSAALGQVGFATAFTAHDRGDFFDDLAGVGRAVGDEGEQGGFAGLGAGEHGDALEAFLQFTCQELEQGGVGFAKVLEQAVAGGFGQKLGREGCCLFLEFRLLVLGGGLFGLSNC